MKHTLAAMVPLLLIVGTSNGREPSSIDDWKEGSLMAEGPLQEIREPLGLVFRFKVENGRLKIDREAWNQSAKEIEKDHPKDDDPFADAVKMVNPNDPNAAAHLEHLKQMQQMIKSQRAAFGEDGPPPAAISLLREIQRRSGSHGGGSGRSGIGETAQWDESFNSDSLSGQADASKDTAEFTFSERTSPQRRLEFHAPGGDVLRIQLTNRQGDMLSLRQAGGGRFSIIAMIGDKIFVDQADSFDAFRSRHQKLMESQILPALARFGIQLELDSAKANQAQP